MKKPQHGLVLAFRRRMETSRAQTSSSRDSEYLARIKVVERFNPSLMRVIETVIDRACAEAKRNREGA